MTPSLEEMIVQDDKSLREVLDRLNHNAQGIVFIVDSRRRLVGCITDGDVRRALLKGNTVASGVLDIVNRNCVYLPMAASSEEISRYFNDDVYHIPLVDDDRVVVDYAAYNRLHRIPVMEPFMNGNEQLYVMDCMKSKWISSQGKYVHQFERMFEKNVNAADGSAVAVANGTVALHLTLATLGIGPGDEVIVPDLTFAASVNAVLHAGAMPVLADVERSSWCLDPAGVEALITPRTRAIMPVHLYGKSADMGRILSIAKRHNLFVVEDTAEAFGARYRGTPLGTLGDAGAFSFFGNKMITTGEGGMVVFKTSAHVERARMLRDHGMQKDRRYWHAEVGYNYRMTNLQAAIGVAQLEQFDQILQHKLDLAAAYIERLSNLKGIELPPSSPDDLNVYWLFTILIDERQFGSRDRLIGRLISKGIETRPMFYPMSAMPLYQRYRGGRDFAVAHELSSRGLSLPSAASLSAKEVERVAASLAEELSLREMLNASPVWEGHV